MSEGGLIFQHVNVAETFFLSKETVSIDNDIHEFIGLMIAFSNAGPHKKVFMCTRTHEQYSYVTVQTRVQRIQRPYTPRQ